MSETVNGTLFDRIILSINDADPKTSTPCFKLPTPKFISYWGKMLNFTRIKVSKPNSIDFEIKVNQEASKNSIYPNTSTKIVIHPETGKNFYSKNIDFLRVQKQCANNEQSAPIEPIDKKPPKPPKNDTDQNPVEEKPNPNNLQLILPNSDINNHSFEFESLENSIEQGLDKSVEKKMDMEIVVERKGIYL